MEVILTLLILVHCNSAKYIFYMLVWSRFFMKRAKCSQFPFSSFLCAPLITEEGVLTLRSFCLRKIIGVSN